MDRTDPSGYASFSAGQLTVIAIAGIVAVMATTALGFFLVNRRFRQGSESQIVVDHQPVIVDGSGWDYSIAQNAIETAAGFWSSQANISVMTRPIVSLSGCDGAGSCILPSTLNKVPSAAAIRAKLAEKGANAKHLTVFVGSIINPGATYSVDGYTDSANGISYIPSSANSFKQTVFWFRWSPAGQVIAHEWGHSFIGPGHVSYPNLMQDTPAFLPIFFNQSAITDAQRVRAREGALRFR